VGHGVHKVLKKSFLKRFGGLEENPVSLRSAFENGPLFKQLVVNLLEAIFTLKKVEKN